MDSSQREDPSHNKHRCEVDDKEPRIIIFDDDDVQEGVKECSNSAIGKIITNKVIHLNSLNNALSSIWSFPKGFKIESLGAQIFQFFFQESKDLDRVIKGSPWIFRNSWIILKRWTRGLDPMELSFATAPASDAEMYEIQGRGAFVKVQVQIDVDKPLLSGVNVGSKKDGVFWVDFQYERVPQFCYRCGLIGHDESSCEAKEVVEDEDRRLGPWLRASNYGRRTNIDHDHKWRDKESSETASNRKKKTMSKDLMDQLNRLTMEEYAETANPKTPREDNERSAESTLAVTTSPTNLQMGEHQKKKVPAIVPLLIQIRRLRRYRSAPTL
ncbi:Zinc finger, CCHC-type [Sesbania bispinosa]|nr:Zinc finger, CCHC-type [Sesbania bispinosa]